MTSNQGHRSVSNPGREELVAEAATLYYRSRLDQEEIARRLGVSRSTVSRMLQEALRTGIVEIRVRHAMSLQEDLQREVVSRFGLRDAMVLDTSGQEDEDHLPRVGRLAARYLDTSIGVGDVLAISWGTAVRAVADELQPRMPRDIEVVQMLGGAGSRNLQVDGTELARRMADLLGGHCRYLNVPLVVDDEATAAALRHQREVRETLAAAAHADLAVVGIGALIPSVSSLLRAGHLTRAEMHGLAKAGAVGDVCGHLFTIEGELVDVPLVRRIVTVSATALRRMPRVVGVAAGTSKAHAILGALRARLVDVLVTDDVTMESVLKLAEG